MKKLFAALPLVAILGACAAHPPLTHVPAQSPRFTSSRSDADEPSDSNGHEAWSPAYANSELREYAESHLTKIPLGYYEAPSTEKAPAAEGNIAGSFAGLNANPDFPYYSFASAAAADKFLQRFSAAPSAYVSQLYELHDDGRCVTFTVIDHYWKEPAHWFGFRAGQRIYGEHLKNFLVQAGTIKGTPEEVKAPLVSETLCAGDRFPVNGRALHIAKVAAASGLNVSSAPGATYPTYPAVVLVDDAGQAVLTELNALRRLKTLTETHATAARASSDNHTCGSSAHATSEDFAANSAQANERAHAIMAAQCSTISRHLDESHVQYDVSKYDVCIETQTNRADSIARGNCD
ncbi:MAG: hypothetical protein ACXVB9_17635 [Bdellovibrionota bacterium]